MTIKLLFIFLTFNLCAQVNTNSLDSSSLAYHQKTMLYSALVPGLGQIKNAIESPQHNHAYWKVPLIYGALGSMGYFLSTNQRTQIQLKTEYTNRLNGGSLDPKWAAYDNQAVLQLYRQYLDWRDLSILGFAAIYLFQIADAGAEAHFVHFDTSPNLSIHISPSVVPQQLIGAKFQLTFR
jgi:hypothetical protein